MPKAAASLARPRRRRLTPEEKREFAARYVELEMELERKQCTKQGLGWIPGWKAGLLGDDVSVEPDQKRKASIRTTQSRLLKDLQALIAEERIRLQEPGLTRAHIGVIRRLLIGMDPDERRSLTAQQVAVAREYARHGDVGRAGWEAGLSGADPRVDPGPDAMKSITAQASRVLTDARVIDRVQQEKIIARSGLTPAKVEQMGREIIETMPHWWSRR